LFFGFSPPPEFPCIFRLQPPSSSSERRTRTPDAGTCPVALPGPSSFAPLFSNAAPYRVFHAVAPTTSPFPLTLFLSDGFLASAGEIDGPSQTSSRIPPNMSLRSTLFLQKPIFGRSARRSFPFQCPSLPVPLRNQRFPQKSTPQAMFICPR